MRRDYHFPDDAATFTVLSDRDIAGPKGIFGGMAGRKAYYILNPDDTERTKTELSSKCVIELKPGDTVSFQTPGGGGYGSPLDRDPKRVLEDVILGKINIERARECYGVIIDNRTNTVDEASTIRSRKQMIKSRSSN